MEYKIYNAVQVKKMADYYKLTITKEVTYGRSIRKYTPKGKANQKKLKNNVQRAKNTVLEKALCNDWTWFVTLTLDKAKYQRDNLSVFQKDLSQWIRDYRKKYRKQNPAFDVKYLFIPELHADGKNWHMHGLLSELPWDDLEPHPVRSLSEKGYLNWAPYQKKFGFCSLGAIRDNTRTALYITKYITKDLARSVTDLDANLYYCSTGLNKAEVVSKGKLTKAVDFSLDFEGAWCSQQFVDQYDFFKDYYLELDL